MDAVGNIEKEHDDSHESSFSPLLEEDRKINSTIGSSSNEPITPQSGDQITPTLITRRSGFRRVASDSVPLNSSTSCLCGKYEGYLPCHYFDYIAGTSTGGRVILAASLYTTHKMCQTQRYHVRTSPHASGRLPREIPRDGQECLWQQKIWDKAAR